MRRFQFRLETALRLRRLAEQQAQSALAEAERAILVAEEALTLALKEYEQHQGYCTRLHARRLNDIALLVAASQYTLVLEEDVDAQREQVRLAVTKREAQREALCARRQEREALDKLREKQRLVHLQEEATEEQAWLDEVAVLRWGRT